jgi:protein-S-isoprenylcysteine O-methyltransferase Ste14
MNTLKQLRAILALPLTVAGLIPGLLLFNDRPIRLGGTWPEPWNRLLPIGGLGLLGVGLFLMVRTISLFINVGHGTLAPWDPPKKLVVRGIYRYVRNPMISGVIAVLLGESIIFGSRPLLIWTIFATVVNMIYMPMSEEPGLAKRFGADYERYRENVPRWIPRLTPWQPPDDPQP